MCIQSLVKFCPLVLKILSGNKILTSTKGHNSVPNLRNLTLYNPNLDIIYVNAYLKFGQILSIGSQDIERKRNSNINQGGPIKGHNSVANLRKMTLYNPNLDTINVNVYAKSG